MMIPNRIRKGFTLIELLVVISIIALLIGLLLPALGQARKNAEQIKSASQIRSLMQGMVQFASDNNESFPIPSVLDRSDFTEPGSTGDNKNRTGNVWSVLIFQKLITAETLVDPAEADPAIREFLNYLYVFDEEDIANANIVQEPRGALYDPRLKGSKLDDEAGDVPSEMAEDVGHNSFAHNIIGGARQDFFWGLVNATSNIPVLGNRGPIYDGNGNEPLNGGVWELVDNKFGTGSTTLLIHGPTTSWAGNIAFGDGHVDFLQNPAPENIRFTEQNATAGDRDALIRDNLFVDQKAEQTNANLRTNMIFRIWKQGINPNVLLNDNFISVRGEGNFAYVDGQGQADAQMPGG